MSVEVLEVTQKDGQSYVKDFPAKIAVTPLLLGVERDVIQTIVRFKFANGVATYVVVGWENDALVLQKELSAWTPAPSRNNP